MALTILDGATFCVCDRMGDVDGVAAASGLFVADTRFLSRSLLRIGGERPDLLSSSQPAPHLARFVFRNPTTNGLQPNELSIERERFVGDAMQERIVIENHAQRPVETVLTLELEADFADIFAVKDIDPGFGTGVAVVLPPPRDPSWDAGTETATFADDTFPARTVVTFSQPCTLEDGAFRFPVSLVHGETWTLIVSVQPLLDGAAPFGRNVIGRHLDEERQRSEQSLVRWNRSRPRLESTHAALVETWERSVWDLAALRMRAPELDLGYLPAAGTPWFMTVFGRDTLVVCLQTMLFGPELATSTLRVLAALQADEDDPDRDAEPGKIIHEVRRGKGALAWRDRYYGSVDSTPLFLILLSELWRWTGDGSLARELAPAARKALRWIDEFGDADGDGFVEYSRRARRGIRNQSWKDSENSMVFRDGRLADAPITPVEVQGYVYDAKLRVAELARKAWGDPELAGRLEREARTLRERFNDVFWLPGGYYALGLDHAKRPIDAVASNMGHLLWSGIVPDERATAVADLLLGEGLWSGWGVRTLSATEVAYNPLVYHNGTVWPHDNSLIAWGLYRAGRIDDLHLIVDRTIEAAVHFEHRLPEVFAGFARERTGVPVEYPTASRPQAWAAGTPILLVRLLLGLEPDPRSRTLRAVPRHVPAWAEGLALSNVHAFERTWDARVAGGAVEISEGSSAAAPPR